MSCVDNPIEEKTAVLNAYRDRGVSFSYLECFERIERMKPLGCFKNI
jgi:hypothetical protein